MNLDHYLLSSIGDSEFKFVSEGIQGQILKIIRFSVIDQEKRIVNLGFGDFDAETGVVDDRVVSSNQDTDKILATVAQATLLFCQNYPNALIYAEGSTLARTRLYQMALNKHWQTVSDHFLVWGLQHDLWHSFETGKNYDAFLAKSI